MAEIRNFKSNAMNISHFDSARDNCTATYETEEKDYINDKINETTYATTNQKSQQAQKQQISRQKTTNKAKLKGKIKKEWSKLCK